MDLFRLFEFLQKTMVSFFLSSVFSYGDFPKTFAFVPRDADGGLCQNFFFYTTALLTRQLQVSVSNYLV